MFTKSPHELNEVPNIGQIKIEGGGTFEDNLAPGSSDKQRLETVSPQNSGFCLPDSHADPWELRPSDWEVLPYLRWAVMSGTCA